MPKIEYIYCDSNIFLAYFKNESGRAELIEQLFEEVQKDDYRKIVTSAFSIIEVAYIADEGVKSKSQKLRADTEEKLDTFWADKSLIEIVDFQEVLARRARNLMRKATEDGFSSLKPPDALHLVSAEMIGAKKFFTYDDLSKFSTILGFDITEPFVDQPRLL